MNKLHALIALMALFCAALVSADYGSFFYADSHRAIGLSYGSPSYVDYSYPQTYADNYAYPSYYMPGNYAGAYNSYDAYPYTGTSYVVGVPNYAGYGTATYGNFTTSNAAPTFNCGGLSLSDAEVIVPRGSAGEAQLTLNNRSHTGFTINSVSVRDGLDYRAPNAYPTNSVVRNKGSTTIRVPVSAAFDAQAGSAALNVVVKGQSPTGKPCTVSGNVKATLTGDGSFGNYDRRTIVYPSNRDYGTAYSTSRYVAKFADP